MPYVSHDIGTFHAVSPTDTCDADLSPILTPRENELPDDMYARWVQLGTFQPLDRLHSHHGLRLPWEYPPEIERIATKFLRLRGKLNPYLYTLAEKAHRSGVPMVRPLYLHWPGRNQAYEHPSHYTLGRDVLVAPVAEPGASAKTEVWFPPGKWVDWFTGERHRGPGTEELTTPLERMPVFVRSGAIVPMQRTMATTPEGPLDVLELAAQRGDGRGRLYEDSGEGFAYERGKFTRTTITQRRSGGTTVLTVGRARGGFAGLPERRSYEIRLAGVPRPREVRLDGERAKSWDYNADTRTVTVRTGVQPTDRKLRVEVG
jgi:alpha-glucosidase (family GH31 glycosyl hydrolase)